MRDVFNPRGKGGSIVREIAAILAQNGHRGVHVEWAPPQKQARHDNYRLWQGSSGGWRLTLNISGEPRIIARLGALSPHVEVEVRRKLDELFGIEIGIEKEDGVMLRQDPSGPASEFAMPALPVDERPLVQEPAPTPVLGPTGDSFSREWLLAILDVLLGGDQEQTVERLYQVVMEEAGKLRLLCDHSKIRKAIVALRQQGGPIEVERQGTSYTWVIRRKEPETVQVVADSVPVSPPGSSAENAEEAAGTPPAMTPDNVLSAIIKMADGVDPSIDGWARIPRMKKMLVDELYDGRHAGYGRLVGVLDALQKTGRLDVRRDEHRPDIWHVRFPDKEPVPPPVPEVPAVSAPASAVQDPLLMALAGHISPVEFCDKLRDLSMAKAVETITSLIEVHRQVRGLLAAIAKDEVFAMMKALVTRINFEREE